MSSTASDPLHAFDDTGPRDNDAIVRLARPGTQAAIKASLAERFRYRREGDQIEIDFPKSDRDAKRKVVAALDEINPRWRRVFVLYPRD
jgi:hypothetical protein